VYCIKRFYMATIPVEAGTLTTVLNTFETAFTGGFSKVYLDAMSLLAILATLEVAIAALWWMLCEENTLAELLKKIMKIGFFIFVVTKYPWLIKCVVDGFVFVGLKAGGGSTDAASVSLIKDPSAIIKIGFELLKSVDKAIVPYNPLNFTKNVVGGLAYFSVILAFFGLAIGVFITYLEFYLISVLGLILIPFGAFKHTAFLAEKVFSTIINFGVRLMVLSFILTTAVPILSGLQMGPNPDTNQVLQLFLIVATIAGLAWHASSLAGSLMSGSPTLSASAVISPVMATGGAALGAALAAKSLSATKTAAGAMHKGEEPPNSGPSRSTLAGSSVVSSGNPSNGSSGGSPGGTSKSYDSPSRNASAGFESSNFLDESVTNPGDSSGSPSGQTSAKHGPAPKNGTSAPKKGPAGVPGWAVLAMAQRAIPQDAHSGAGVSVPLRSD
jgi:type IV secretion system protein TrbL